MTVRQVRENENPSQTLVEFPSVQATAQFAHEARSSGLRVRLPHVARPMTRRSFRAMLLGALLGGVGLGLIGGFAEAGALGLPRLAPLFAAPLGAVTALLAVFGASLGGLIAALLTLAPEPELAPSAAARAVVQETRPAEQDWEELARHYGGHPANGGEGSYEQEGRPHNNGQEQPREHPHEPPSVNRWLAWLCTVFTAGVLLTATTYIWYLSIAYGPGSNQQTRIGYTMKNVQRIPADTPEQAGAAMAQMLGGAARLPTPADPLVAAVLAPLVAARGQTLVFGAAEAEARPLDTLALECVRALSDSPVVVVVSPREPAFALPAAYAAAHFRAPVVPVGAAGLPEGVRTALADGRQRLLLVAAPERLVSSGQLTGLRAHGRVERVAAGNIYRHALLWARGRWGDFGWGIHENVMKDGYYHFAMANPDAPAFAAAGLPMAYQGNHGPLLYTPKADLDELTDQYLWRLGPDFFSIPSDGPFVNVRVLGGMQSVSYNAQARADLALETHPYRNQVTGMSGMAALGWCWFFIGLAGFVWSLFAIPRRLPSVGFYPRLYWPLAMLTLGPVGIAAFLLAYQDRPMDRHGKMTHFVRPPWAEAVAATIMGMGIGMALMIASMYLFELNGLPLFTGLAFTPLFWLGAPMAALMWFLMVVPAIAISTLLFIGPMMAEMKEVPYWRGVRMAFSTVAWSMVAASVGMWTLSWWWMNWKGLMSHEDLWLWVTPLWWATVMGFLTALVPNYWMVRAGWKNGGM